MHFFIYWNFFIINRKSHTALFLYFCMSSKTDQGFSLLCLLLWWHNKRHLKHSSFEWFWIFCKKKFEFSYLQKLEYTMMLLNYCFSKQLHVGCPLILLAHLDPICCPCASGSYNVSFIFANSSICVYIMFDFFNDGMYTMFFTSYKDLHFDFVIITINRFLLN